MLKLTASELNRFMACNGFKSLKTVEDFQPDDTSSKEGETAHWYCEQVKLGKNPVDVIGVKAPTGMYVTEEMAYYCDEYLKAILDGGVVEYSKVYECSNFTVSSRADYIKEDGDTLYVFDFKYGYKIVEPENNWTLLWYAGTYKHQNPDNIKNMKQIVFRIYQPRAFHPMGTIREWVISLDEFAKYQQQLFDTLNNPADTVKCGEHCYRCKSLSNCPAAQLSTMNAIDMAERAFDSEVSDENLSWLLTNLKRAEDLIKQNYKAYEELALHRLKSGQKLKGYSMLKAVGNNTWNEDIDADIVKLMTGVDITTSKLITPSQAVKLGIDKETIKSFTYRPENGYKLVQFDESKQAEKIFNKKGK